MINISRPRLVYPLDSSRWNIDRITRTMTRSVRLVLARKRDSSKPNQILAMCGILVDDTMLLQVSMEHEQTIERVSISINAGISSVPIQELGRVRQDGICREDDDYQGSDR